MTTATLQKPAKVRKYISGHGFLDRDTIIQLAEHNLNARLRGQHMKPKLLRTNQGVDGMSVYFMGAADDRDGTLRVVGLVVGTGQSFRGSINTKTSEGPIDIAQASA